MDEQASTGTEPTATPPALDAQAVADVVTDAVTQAPTEEDAEVSQDTVAVAEVESPVEGAVAVSEDSTHFHGNESNPPEKTDEVASGGEVPESSAPVATPPESEPTETVAPHESVPVVETVHEEVVPVTPTSYGSVEPPPVIAPPVVQVFGSRAREFGARALLSRQVRKLKKFVVIMEKLQKRGTISNKEVMLLTHVSHATATRYLRQLEKEGRIKKGTAGGRATSYIVS